MKNSFVFLLVLILSDRIFGQGIGFGASLPCAINVNCTRAIAYQNVIEGVFWLKYNTAFFVNNGIQDGRLLFITAKHVVENLSVGDTATLSVKFNYESEDCSNPSVEPGGIIGNYSAILRVKSELTDIALLEFVGEDLPNIPIQMLGWDKRYWQLGESLVSIGHPKGDIKKIAFIGNVVYANNYTIKAQVFKGDGAMQNGNSGSPLINETLRVYGISSGGFIYECEDSIQSEIIFSTIGYDWAAFQPFLDPLNTGILYLDGLEASLPVELISYTSEVKGNEIFLKWKTAAEVNNYGFEVERNSGTSWEKIGFVNGNGNSNSEKNYSFRDSPIKGNAFSYRLKQIDTDGRFSYSSEILVNLVLEEYFLSQNYPNPFNSETVIEFGVPEDVKNGRLTIYNMLGERVMELVNGSLNAGFYKYNWDAANFASGLYIYELRTEKFASVKKMLLLK